MLTRDSTIIDVEKCINASSMLLSEVQPITLVIIHGKNQWKAHLKHYTNIDDSPYSKNSQYFNSNTILCDINTFAEA